MKASWTVVKNLINSAPRKKDLYLSILDEEGNITSANSNMQKGFELKNPRQSKTNFFDLLHPVHINHFRKVIREAAKRKEQITAELFIKNKFDHPVKWQVSHLRSAKNNKPIYFCIGYSDVDADRLQENETVVHAFLSQTPTLAWVVDEDGRLVFASNAFFRHFGIHEKDSLYKKMSALVPPAIFKSMFDKHTEVLHSGKVIRTTERVRLADGSNHLSYVTIFPIEKEVAGKKLLGGYAVNLPDTTKLETDLREANERLLTLSHVASDAIWEWDMQTGKIFRNSILMQMIGYQPEASKGLSWWLRRIHPEDRHRVSDTVREVTETNQHSWQDEYRFKCADGQYKHIRDKGFVIYENGLPVKMVGSLHDISALKEMENKLANEKLQRQKEISETIIQVQEKERTRIGHELHDNVNQVLSSALLFADMLKAEDSEQARAREKIQAYISMAIEEIRTLSKELVVPQLKEKGLSNGIQALIEDINLTHKVKFTFTHDPGTDSLSSGKKITLFRIVQEQAKNILKHSKAKKADIQLQALNGVIQLIIKDNGIGFDSTHTHRGIGLSNIYERVSFYNGTVDIRTAAGKGCTVIVTLPLE